LVAIEEQMYLCLGETLSFEELYLTVATLRVSTFTLVYPGLLSSTAMDLLHWMVATYYTTYKSVIPHFLPDDIEKLLQKEKKASKIDKNSSRLDNIQNFVLAEKGQTMIVFPDLWTLYGMIGESVREHPQVALLLSVHTQNQKDIHRWQIKRGQVSVILCTYAEIFQDFADLQKIIRVDPHKWYYANQQDPRYKVGDVLNFLAETTGAVVEERALFPSELKA